MLDRVCLGCGERLPLTSRSDRTTCSDACRTRLSRIRRVVRLPAPRLDVLIAGLDPARAEALLVTLIAMAARDSWTAAAWILERRWPERWGPPALRTRILEDELRS